MLPLLSRIVGPGALARRLPVIAWLPRYTLEDAVSDLVAGITVGLTLMPQAIAYAALAGLGPQYGLYSAFAGSFVYILFGTCKEVNIGPTALLSLLTFNYTHDTNPDLAVLLCFLSGCVELLCGLLHLGFLMEFVSVPVVSGFTSAAALIIASSQLKGLLGLQYNAESFVEAWHQLFVNISKTRVGDLVLSLCCVTVLLLLRKLKDVRPGGKQQTARQKVLGKALFFVSTGRNAMVVVVCAAAAYFFTTRGTPPFLLTGKIQPGLPTVAPPPFSTAVGNTTLSFLDMCKQLGSGIGVVPIISILGNVAIAKAFSMRLDATQEMITLGLCNIAGSFVRSMPVTGSFSRSAVNNASGVRTPMGGLYTGILIVLALSLLTPYFYYIPRATLSSVIICAVIFMVEVTMLPALWRTSKRDLIPALVTFVACLVLGVELGILIGIAVDLCFMVYYNARPRVTVERVVCPGGGPEYVLVTPGCGLLFPAADYVRDAVAEAAGAGPAPVVLSCRHVQQVDYTAAQGVVAAARDFAAEGRTFALCHARPEVALVLRAAAGQHELLVVAGDAELFAVLAGAGSELANGRADIKVELDGASPNHAAAETPEEVNTRV